MFGVDFTSKGFEIIDKVGVGVSGEVYKALKLSSARTTNINSNSAAEPRPDEYVAIKTIGNLFDDELNVKYSLREIRLLKHFAGFPHIIDFKGAFILGNSLNIVTDLMQTDLAHLLQRNGPLSSHLTKKFTFQILQALSHLHSAQVLHRDLKPLNILVTSDQNIKLCDFGSVGCRDQRASLKKTWLQVVQTRHYRAPEGLIVSAKFSEYGPEVDIFSLGIIIVEMLTGHKCSGNTDNAQLEEYLDLLGTPPKQFLKALGSKSVLAVLKKPVPSKLDVLLEEHHSFQHFVKKMLCWEAAHRISVQTAIASPLFADLPAVQFAPPAPFDWSYETSSLNIDDFSEMIRKEVDSIF